MLRETFNLAIKAILKNKLRTILTMLGIIIGTTAVIVIMNLMNSFENQLLESFQGMGTLSVTATTTDPADGLEESEVERFVQENSSIFSGYSPVVTLPKSSIASADGAKTAKTTIYGAGAGYDTIKNLKLSDGTFLNYVDITSARPSVVIGSYVKQTLFGDEDAIGKQIMVNGQLYTVRGVLEQTITGQDGKGTSDDQVIIPYRNAVQYATNAKLSNVNYEVVSEDQITAAVDALNKFYYDKLKNYSKYSVAAAQGLVSTLGEVMGLLNTVLIVITSVSLIVGGIGIMNIMFITVIERTREIGIRTAIGAKPNLILRQFLAEAIITSFVGGMIGIILGLIFTAVACAIIDIKFVLSYWSIIIAVLFSLGIGCLFGYLPAKRAAYLNPISALNTE